MTSQIVAAHRPRTDRSDVLSLDVRHDNVARTFLFGRSAGEIRGEIALTVLYGVVKYGARYAQYCDTSALLI